LASGAYVIGADVGEHGVTVEIFDLSLRRVDRVFRRLATRATSPARVARALTEAVAEIRRANPGPDDALVGIGLGLPGVVDTAEDGTTTIHAQSLGWQPTSLERVFGSMGGVPTFADNGAKTLATAEMWFGAARGRAHSIVVLVGRGLGIGVIAGGRLLRGTSSSAGEWGHTKVSLGGPSCQCGAQGCIEAYVGGDAVTRRWREAGAKVTGTDAEVFAQLIDVADAGDAIAARVLSETIEILGLGLANLVNLFNPEQIVMGGWAGLRLVERRQSELQEQVARFALSRPAEQVVLEPGKVGEDAVALGAALLPLERLIDGTLSAPKGRPTGKAPA
jgi:predicted NBD/HSP70 family sugar kinase